MESGERIKIGGGLETLEGIVSRVVFNNPSNGWTVIRLDSKDSPLPHTVVGSFQQVSKGQSLRFTGRFTRDPKHGRQFNAETCLPLDPKTAIGIEKFLGSGLIPGIGPVMAKRIVKQFGMDSLCVIEREPKKLGQVPGIGSKRAEAISKALLEQKGVRDVMIFLESTGISPAFAQRIQKCYGNDAIRIVSENPYKLASDINGIGFLSADKIAANLGISKDSQNRIEAGVLFALMELAKDGHVFAFLGELVGHAEALLEADAEKIEQAVERLVLMGLVRREGTAPDFAVYLPTLYKAEKMSALKLKNLIESNIPSIKANLEEAIKAAEAKCGLSFAPNQRRAFKALASSSVMILTGGPGTGKTTLLKGLAFFLESAGNHALLAAPTGRAARRMSEATGRDASTLHRLLEFSPRTSRFERNNSNPLAADAVIVDEVSMVDLELFAALMDALKPGARLLLVGDPDQLPSVGPGSVLCDLIELSQKAPGRIAAVHLNEVFRQARMSLIVTGAHDILAGIEPKTGEKGSNADFFIIERNEPEECLSIIKELVLSRIPLRFGFHPIDDIQVLCPMHKGLLGAANLNQELQDLLNPSQESSDGEKGIFRLGDKVMQIRNNYDLEVFNGDIGKVAVVHKDLEYIEVVFADKKVRYPASETDQLALSYACSVHKSQGSEYPAVVMPVHTQHYVMLRRNLLYTAVTRGKKLVILVGTRKAIGIAIRTDARNERRSGLVNRVRRALGA